MTKRRRKDTQEFKEDVKLVLEHDYKTTEAAKNLGTHLNQLGRWKREFASENLGNENSESSATLRAELNGSPSKKEDEKFLRIYKGIQNHCGMPH